MNYLVYLVYPAMLVLLFAGSKRYKKGEWNDEFLGYNQTKYFQGYLAVCIMLHHVGQELCASWQTYPLSPGLEFFVPLGYLFVGAFFMFSGYGLYVSWQKKPDYLGKGFFKRRVLPIIIAYYASCWIFLIVRFIMGQRPDTWTLFCFISGIKLSNPNGWFAFVMPFFYLFFYISFKYCKKRPILAVFFFVFLYTLLGTFIDHNDYLMNGQWWYNCVQMFWIGMLIAKYKDALIAWAKKRYPLKVVLCIILFHASWVLGVILQNNFSYYAENWGAPRFIIVLFRWITLTGDALTSTFFCFLALLFGLKIKIGNKLLGFMGTITLEFYLMHGLTLELFAYQFCDTVPSIVRITNGALLVVIVFAAGIPLALGLKRICHAKSV